MLQFHGDETVEYCEQAQKFSVPIMKALRIREPKDIARAELYPGDTILLDAFHQELYGGSGYSFDWEWLHKAVSSKKVFLAGGITPENVLDALAVGSYGIDLCSGVEQVPGIKDPEKMQKLFDVVKGYNDGTAKSPEQAPRGNGGCLQLH